MGVEAYLDHFEAVSEFPSPHFENDTCGETACLVLEHCKDGAPITGDALFVVREDMAAKGYRVNGGTTLGELADYFHWHRGLDIFEACPYGTAYDVIHRTIRDEYNAATGCGIVLQVDHAYNLDGNERGVFSHFVAIGAIHPVKGYLVANGDDVNALNPHHGQVIPSRWIPWSNIEAADPKGVLVVRGLPHHVAAPVGAVAAGPVAPSPSPAYLDKENVTVFRTELQAAQQAAQALVAALAKAIASLPQQQG